MLKNEVIARGKFISNWRSSKNLRLGSIALVTSALSTLCAFILQLFLTNTLGATDYGRYATVTTWVAVLVLVAKLGFDATSLRYLSVYAAKNDWASARGFLRFTTTASLTMAVCLACVAIAIASLTKGFSEVGGWQFLVITYAAVPIATCAELQGARLQAMSHPATFQIVYGIGKPLLLITGVCTALVLTSSVSPAQVLAINSFVCLATLLVLTWRFRPQELRGGVMQLDIRSWLNVSWPLYLVAISQIVLSRADVLIVGSLLDAKEVGVYFIANQLATLVTFGISSVNSVTAPTIARCYSTNDMQGLQRALKESARIVTLYTVPVVAGLVLCGPVVLRMFGTEFQTGFLPLMILSVGQLVIAYCGPVGFLLTMTEHQRVALAAIGSSALLQIAITLVLTSNWGLLGAATGAALSNAARSLLLTRIVRKRLGLSAKAF